MRASTLLSAGLASAAAAVLTACRGAARAPAPEPTTTVSRPATEGRDTPATRPVDVGRGASVAFGYSSGTRRYEVVTRAAVELVADSAPAQSDSLVTRAYVTYVLGGGGVGQSVGGAIDSVFVSSRRAPSTSQAVTTAVPFSGTLTTSGVRLASAEAAPEAAAAPCGPGSTDALLDVARDLIIALPPSIAEGAAWRDSSITTTCRGNVPTTVSTVSEYRVTRVADDTNARTATIERVSRSTISGQGSGGSTGATFTGTGSTQARFTFDLAAGSYRDGELASAADLTITVGGRAQRLTQRGNTHVVLLQLVP